MKTCPSCGHEHLGDCGGLTFAERMRSVAMNYHPSATPGKGRRTGSDGTRRWDGRLERYAAARAEGIQPKTTRTRDVDDARRISDATQQAFRADAVSEAMG